MTIKKIGTLEIESEAEHLNTRFIKIQKIGIVLITLILLAAFLGLFGKGLLSKISQTSGDLTILYDKFIRAQAATLYHIEINHTPNNKIIKFWVEPSLYNHLSIKSMMPTPEGSEIVDNKIVYSFNTANTSSIKITMVAEPEHFGLISAKIGLFKGDEIQLQQLIYP